jgi:4-diphosphocytidyl-2-C-methyl-D-erythritol kinase
LDKDHVNVAGVISALASGDDAALAATMGNALELSAISLYSEVEKIKNALKAEGFSLVLMSGSGSSVFALSENYRKMAKAETKFTKMGYTVILTTFQLPQKGK